MDFVWHMLLESPLKLLAGAILVEAVLATCWWFRPGRTTSWLVVGGPLLATVLLIVQHLVVTDRERIGQILDALALAVDCEDVDAIADALDEDYEAEGMDKEAFLARVESAFERAEIDEVKILNTKITVEGDAASVNLRAHCRIRASDWPYDYFPSAWLLRFVRRDDDWQVQHIRQTKYEGGLAPGDLLKMAGD